MRMVKIVTSSGQLLEPGIEVPPEATSISIGKDGTVTATMAGSTEPEEIGQITLANFVNPAGLTALGNNLFAESGASGQPLDTVPGEDGVGSIQQFTLESSNVNMVEEMVGMITAQRGYEMNAKVIAACDQMLQFANQTL